MKRRVGKWIAIGTVVAVPTVLSVLSYLDHRALQRELRMAWAEGLPTNASEFASTIPTATEAENAAPYYVKMRGKLNYRQLNTPSPSYELTFKPSKAVIEQAKLILEQYHDVLDYADQAALRPKCWFNRDWSDLGEAFRYPDSSDMIALARLLRLRGSLAALQGDVQGALKNAREIRKLSGHVEVIFSHFSRAQIYGISVRQLANWAFVHRDRVAYRDELAKTLDAYPAFDWKAEHRGDLFTLLYEVEIEKSEKELRKAGYKDDDMPTLVDKLPGLVIGKTRALLMLIQVERAKWKALDLPSGARSRALADTYQKEELASYAFPIVHQRVHSSYLGQISDEERDWKMRARLLEYRILLRALSAPSIPRSLSPPITLDGAPVDYKFDGKQIVISAKMGVYGPVEELKMPDDPPPLPRIP